MSSSAKEAGILGSERGRRRRVSVILSGYAWAGGEYLPDCRVSGVLSELLSHGQYLLCS